MKQLVCEMCGGTDLLKQEGVFVCQTCGTKYSVEEAKKMMIEGNVDVSGSTVKVDNADRLENLYQIARRAKDDNNSENAAKYYDMILVDDPSSWEASFYVVYFKAMECKIAQISSAAVSLENCLDSVLNLINKYVVERTDKISAVSEVVFRSILAANMLSGGAKSHYDGISYDIKSNYTQEYINNVCAARDICYTCGNIIDKMFSGDNEIAKKAVDAWKAGIKIHEGVMSYFSSVTSNKAIVTSYVEKIGKYDSNYAYGEKKKSIESEISSLKAQEKNIQNRKITSKTGPLVGGIFFVVLGFVFMAMSDGDGFIIGIAIFEIVVGGLMVLGGSATSSVKSQRESQQRDLEAVREIISAKEKELANLK